MLIHIEILLKISSIILYYNSMRLLLLFILILVTILFIKRLKYENYYQPSISNTLNKNVFITFGAGSQDYYDAVNRLTSQANKLNIFDTIIGYTDNDLKNDTEFWNKHSNFILNNKRGYGYWLWKPYLIMKTLETMNENDILVYADCGCEIKSKNKNNFLNIFDIVKNDLIIGSYTSNEREYNKMDLLLYLNMNENKYFTSQHQASTICILNCNETYKLVKEWYEIGCNYNLIDDSPSINMNYPTFIEHRHDQSIFSLLTKKYNIYSKKSIESVINIARNISGITIETFNDSIISNLSNRKGFGFYSMFFFMLNHYIYCKINKINFKIKTDSWLFKYNNGWTDYFINTELIYNSNNNSKDFSVLDVLGNYTTEMYINAINDIYVYNTITSNKITDVKFQFKLIDNQYDSIFIRRGDKLAEESKYYPDELYLQLLLEKNPTCNTIYLQTDDYNSYINLNKYITNNKLSINLYTLCDENSFGVILNNMQRNKLNNAAINNQNNKDYLSSIINNLNNTKSVEDMNKDEIYKHTLDMIIGVDLVRKSNICICDFQSNVTRFIKLSHNNPNNVYNIIDPMYQINYNKIIKPWLFI